MNNFVFYSPTEFVFGKATEMQVGALARKHGARKVMIVYGGGSVVRSGLLDRVKQSLQEAGIEYCLMGACSRIRWIQKCMKALNSAAVNRLICCCLWVVVLSLIQPKP